MNNRLSFVLAVLIAGSLLAGDVCDDIPEESDSSSAEKGLGGVG